MSIFKPRAKAARLGGLAAFVILSVTFFLLEYLAFGLRWGFLTGEREIDPIFGDFSLSSLIFTNLLMGLFLSLPLALALFLLGPGRPGFWSATLGFPLLLHLGADSIASAYEFQFGATWGPHEAFFELLYHPIQTPALYITAIALFIWWIAPLRQTPDLPERRH